MIPQNQVTNFSLDFLKHAMELCLDSYTDMAPYNDVLLFGRGQSEFMKPAFFIFPEGDSLIVLIRGTDTACDAMTDVTFEEIEDEEGFHYHSGFYYAALDCYETIRDHLGAYNTVYLIGHSYGGSVATVLHILLGRVYPSRDINTIAYNPAPAVERSAIEYFENKIVTVIYRHDIVSSLSAPNIYARLHLLKFALGNMKETKIAKLIHDFMKKHFSDLGENVLSVIDYSTPMITGSLIEQANGAIMYVRHVQGCVYHIKKHPKRILENNRINGEKFNKVTLCPKCIEDHLPQYGITAMQRIHQ